nr:hypothetical protein [Tanacetum cinerariifolium]
MVNTRNTDPRVLDDVLRNAVLEVVQEANALVNATLTTIQSNVTSLNDRIEGLLIFRTLLVDFPKFSGEDVNGWIFMVKQFFSFDIVNEDQKLIEIAARFNNVYEDPMVEIKNLNQDGEVKVYQDQFEVLLNRLELGESYAVSLFIKGLKSEISMLVMFKPTILKDAFCLARMQEATLALTKTKSVSQFASYRSNSGSYENRYTSNATLANSTVVKPLLPSPSDSTAKTMKTGFRKQLTQKELDGKKQKGCVSIVIKAKKLPCKLTATTLLRVNVANGNKMFSSFKSSWSASLHCLLHGLPHFIVSDKDNVFLSHFLKSLFKVLKVNLQTSTAYHPQSDGQREVVNRCLDKNLKGKGFDTNSKPSQCHVQGTCQTIINHGGIRNGGGRGMPNMRGNVCRGRKFGFDKSADVLDKELEDYPFVDKRPREVEDNLMQKKLQISLNQNYYNEESDRPSSMPNPHAVSAGLKLSYDDEERNSSITSKEMNVKLLHFDMYYNITRRVPFVARLITRTNEATRPLFRWPTYELLTP